MSKGIEWLRDSINNTLKFGALDEREIGFQIAMQEALELIDQLDEPEVLSQELPVIPKFVAEYITYMKEEKTLVEVVYLSLEQIELGTGGVEPIDFWISRFGDKFSRAWLDGYTVEEEQKYVVPIDENHALCKFTNVVWGIYKENTDKLYLEDYFKFTEQEISDYDGRFWPFAVKVEELEE